MGEAFSGKAESHQQSWWHESEHGKAVAFRDRG